MEAVQREFDFPNVEHSIAELRGDVPLDNYFPEEEANKIAELESFNKHLFRPNTYLHKWWARRSGTTFRYILKQLVPNLELRHYYEPGGLEGITILDPMMGGGTTLHEAIRLGANVIGYDIDPIPVLQAKASLANINPYDKRTVFYECQKELKKRLDRHFLTKCPLCTRESEIQFVLYGIRKILNNCEVIVVDSFTLRIESNGDHKKLEDFYPLKRVIRGKNSWILIDKKDTRYRTINGKDSDILSIPFNERYIPLVVVGNCKQHGNFFKTIDAEDLQVLENARKLTKKINLPPPDNLRVTHGPKSDDLINRKVSFFSELFFPRQLLYLSEAKNLLDSLPGEHRLWMALLVSTSLEFNSALCGYKGAEKRRPGAIRHVFSHHAYSFPYTALENNPVFPGNTSGTLSRLFISRIFTAGKWAKAPVERKHLEENKWAKITIYGESDIGKECSSISHFNGQNRLFFVKQNDSSKIPQPDRSVDFVVTDPPYFDNVQYSDLSHFFRCWLRWFLPHFDGWDYLVTSSAVAESRDFQIKFGNVLTNIWSECNRVLARPHGRLIFTYHHWKVNAWVQLSSALAKSRFRLINYYVIHSENPISVHIKNLKALTHDTILVLKPVGVDSADGKKWDKPQNIVMDNSYLFCKGCAQTLGWVLENNLSFDAITKIWKDLLRTE